MSGFGDTPTLIVSSNDIALLDAKVRQLATDVQSQSANVPVNTFVNWTNFFAAWTAWRTANAGGSLAIPFIVQTNVVPQFTDFVGQYNELRRELVAIAGFTTAVAESGPTGEDTSTLTTIIKSAAQAATIVGVAYVGFLALPDLIEKLIAKRRAK